MVPCVDFSVIIPHRNSVSLLPKLLNSIPVSDRIEVILVDNSPNPINKEQICIDRKYSLLFSAPDRGAGGARNVGIECAKGKWLIFADADDYFAEGAFDTFFQYIDSSAEIIYYCAEGIYIDTGKRSTRGDGYTNLVRGYLKGTIDEMKLRLLFHVPWAKMVRKSLIDRHNLRYDEVVASNDEFFSLLSGYYAESVQAVDTIVYHVTVSTGSLTKRLDKAVVLSKFGVHLRCNKFVKQHGLPEYQKSIMNEWYHSMRFGFKPFFHCMVLLFRYRQNPFIGWRNWYGTVLMLRKSYKEDKKYFKK